MSDDLYEHPLKTKQPLGLFAHRPAKAQYQSQNQKH